MAQKILKEQEDFGNVTNSYLGREMWYSNDFFINSLILNFITDAEDDLVNELKKIYVGVLGNPGLDAEAINMDDEFEGYLIKTHFDIDIQLDLFSHFVSYHLYGMQLSDERARFNLLPEMCEKLLLLMDKEALLKKAILEDVHDDLEVDIKSPRLNIATDLFVAGMSFILGHEIGHHFLKHTESNGRNLVSKFIPTDVTYNQRYLDEFAADDFGFNLLIRGMKKRNDNTLFAPLIVILMLALYDKHPEEASQYHPSLRDRYLNLLSRVSEHNEAIALTLQRIFNDIATWINHTLLGYWKTEWWK
ncbi:hypothetical protein B4U37_01925 [Sutcliffiella horikoshii]|uniref:Peptidase M48 domain-containing protein n=1 Tax=Sutcliffiella horikoshii TaxID=79883 RepID=A0ABM6KPW0_9BACI|nr:hypothetical protein B4U37_01925 [Sutcliffiella horikoshii]